LASQWGFVGMRLAFRYPSLIVADPTETTAAPEPDKNVGRYRLSFIARWFGL
jgi:hypothetical protein